MSDLPPNGSSQFARPTSTTAARAVVDSLVAHEVRYVFGLPGVQLDPLYAALYDARDRIQVIHTRHEQATSYMADGYARSTGRVGVCAVVPGPGLLNAMAGLATAYGCCSPVLCLSGQVPSRMVNTGLGALHEIDDQQDMLTPITRHAERITEAALVPAAMRRAFAMLTGAGGRGPVEVEIPPDVLVDTTTAGAVEPAVGEPWELDDAALTHAARLLSGATSPVIVSGGGVLNAGAWSELRALAEHLQSPVLLTPNGKGALSDRHHLAMNLRAARELLPGADLVLAVGTRLGNWLLSSTLPSDVPLIRVDADSAQLSRRRQPTVGLHGDAKAVLCALSAAVTSTSVPRPSLRDEMNTLKARVAVEVNALDPQARFGLAIRDAIPDDAIVVNETTQVGAWCALGFPVYQPRTFLTSGYQGTLGSGFPIALGAKVGNPDRVVISINGDGGFMYNVGELSTLVGQDIAVIIVVFNDNAYGNVRRTQIEQYGGRVLASDLYNPDFLQLAESFGLSATRVSTPEALASAIRNAVGTGRPALVEVTVGPMPSPGALLGWPPPPGSPVATPPK